jgi:transitional endoplasmic reticulum ATPase
MLYQSQKKEAFIHDLAEAGNDLEDYANQLSSAIRDTPPAFRKKIKSFIKTSLIKELEILEYSGKSEIEKNVEIIKKMFNLESHEIDLVVFLFIMGSFNVPESLFDINLGCDRFAGRKYLDNILGLTTTQTARTISKLEKMGIMYNGPHSISLDDDIITLLQNPHSDQLSKQYFQPINPCKIPLDFHFVEPRVLSFLKQLVRIKSESSTNILFYGPPGTGKSTMANALANTAKVPVYAITRDERNKSENCRTAIIACMNMTNTGKGSVIIVDEADNLLNTMNSWTLRGETQDKGWLNNLLEKPGTRMIWITNRIEGIEDSVLRRFAYVLEFKPFSTRQRTILFERILRTNRAKRFCSKSDIEMFAKKYQITAGSFDLAVKKAKDTGAKSKTDFKNTVCLCLDANLALKNRSKKVDYNNFNDNSYTLEGINLSENVNEIIGQLERFNSIKSNKSMLMRVLHYFFTGLQGQGKLLWAIIWLSDLKDRSSSVDIATFKVCMLARVKKTSGMPLLRQKERMPY